MSGDGELHCLKITKLELVGPQGEGRRAGEIGYLLRFGRGVHRNPLLTWIDVAGRNSSSNVEWDNQ